MNLELLWLVPLLPLLGAAVNGAIGARMGRTFTTIVGVGSVWAAFLVALAFAFSNPFQGAAANHYPVTSLPFYWFDAGVLQLKLSLLLDPLSTVMILIVTGVGALIHTYSIGYMADDAGYNRYFAYLNLFTFSMLILVLGSSFLLMFVGWELVGLCSYLLIGFWYDRDSATNAGKKAFIVNRVGDWAFIIGMILTFALFVTRAPGSAGLEFQPIFDYLVTASHTGTALSGSLVLIPMIAFLLFIGATGKSAQLPILHVWLPDAMEGPTPVSALIHAATMVTAGVYMVSRCHVFFVLSPEVMSLVAWIGLITAFVAGATAIAQVDIKRVLAYSTISQIGFMFIGAGVGAFSYSIFHLMTHAFFKALLFLASGAVIHAMHNEQDMRRMGGLYNRMKPVAILMLVGVATISGFPLLSAFWSKDAILARAGEHNIWLWLFGSITAAITAFYMCRLWLMTFWGEEHWQTALQHAPAAVSTRSASGSPSDAPHTPPEPGTHGGAVALHATPMVMIWPMAVLALLSIIGGLIFRNSLPEFLAPVFADLPAPVGANGSFLSEPALFAIAILVFLVGAVWAYLIYGRGSNSDSPAWAKSGLFGFLSHAWLIDYAAHVVFAEGGEMAAERAYRDIEVRGIDRGGVGGLAMGVQGIARQIRWVQSGVVGDYALAMAVGVAGLVAYFVLR